MIRKEFILPTGNTESFDIVHGGEIVTVCAFTPDNQVILVEQFRPAQEKLLLEIPGGGIKSGEAIERAAERELLEETGYKGDLQYVCKTSKSAYNTAVHHNFVATNCRQIAEPLPEDNGEPVQIKLLHIEDFIKHLYSNNLTDVDTGFLALHYLGIIK